MITASQVLHSLTAVYLGGCAITMTLLAFRAFLPGHVWDEIEKVCDKHSGALPRSWLSALVALVLTPVVFLWPLVLLLELRKWLRKRGWLK
jgi:hypothetical protein